MPLQLFGDFGFSGGFDTAPNPYQDSQVCINWYPEISPSQQAKEPVALLGCPGLVGLASTRSIPTLGTEWAVPSSVTDQPVRGMWKITSVPNLALVVIGNTAYTLNYVSAPTLASFWGMLTNGSPVITSATISPFGVGPFPSNLNIGDTIIDPVGFIPANTTIISFDPVAMTVTMSANSTGSSPTSGYNLTHSLPVGYTLTAVGTLLTSTGPVRMRDNGLGGVVCLVDGSQNGYYYVYGSAGSAVGVVGTFTRIVDPNFLGSTMIACIDGWWIFNQPGTQKFYTNSAPYSTAYNASYYAYKDAFSDSLVGVMESKEELWLIGSQTTEIWYDAGGQYFPFQRLVGTLLQVGCSAAQTIARYSIGGNDGLIWLGQSDRGTNVVIRTVGFSYEVVSTPAVSDAITQMSTISDAFAYTYQADGHEFYVLTFPTADQTWVYDGTLPPELAWHQRLSYDPYAQQFHRHRSNSYMLFNNLNIVGDYQNGTIYNYTRSAYSDAAWPIYARRRSPFIWTEERTRVFMQSLQIEFAPGVGLPSGTWTNPQAFLSISRDYGTTYGPPVSQPIGQQGQYVNRCLWRKLGWSRGAVAQIDVIDPVRRDIVGATLRAASEPQI